MKTKIFSGIYALIFAAFTYLQLNDPDPVIWVAIYGAVAFASLLRVVEVYHQIVFLTLTIVLAGYSLLYIPGFFEYLMQPNKNEIVGEMVYKKPYIEETREFIGLLMASAANFHQFKMKG
ncbi:transmembrane 220 family protein [Reichenbachiella ulvae]|uniref:Transmembrane 220 family protein n=1 Tax=Reichenbachiella ulvae TaxID=2980104 RepID=A0ABT3CNJ1_9BACT|nr:transmembrane 220 family protein [Reichenbachiella ulvae]MCV9385126.1 transmembrane 220 family protein [Reichenbachiella ulvae]